MAISKINYLLNNVLKIGDSYSGSDLVDFNNLTATGFYRIIHGQNASNPPYSSSNIYGMCVVLAINPYILQVFISGDSNVPIYRRMYVDTSWRAWRTVGGGFLSFLKNFFGSEVLRYE